VLTLVLTVPAPARLWALHSHPTLGTQARDRIEGNIPSGTRLYYVGWHGAGPPLVAHTAVVQAAFGDHFGYGREHYHFLKQAFERGYADYAKGSAPRDVIAQHHNSRSLALRRRCRARSRTAC
jgi:hypothetical protein